MSEKLSYDEQLKSKLNDLPVPDVETAWQKMELLLDKKEDDDIVPPVLFKSCAGWGLLLLLLLIAAWLGFNANHKTKKTKQINPVTQTDTGKIPEQNKMPGTRPVIASGKPNTLRADSAIHERNNTTIPTNVPKDAIDQTGISGNGNIILRNHSKKKSKAQKHYTLFNKETDVPPSKSSIKNDSVKLDFQTKTNRTPAIIDSIMNDFAENNDSSLIKENTITDTALISAKDNVTKNNKDTAIIAGNKKNDKKTNSFYFGAGLTLQQQIPFNGQKAYAYNYYGRKGSLTDYLPSVFTRFYKNKKWFLQSEFRYGAPQLTKEIAYNKSVLRDSGTFISINTTLRLKKTFYHQASLSYNHYILPKWAVGAGALYSRFYRAVSESEVRYINDQTLVDTVIGKTIQSIKKDSLSFFTNSQMHLLLQTNYQWKNFTLGLTYTKALQPFIKYTDNNGLPKKETNQSFHVFLRYEFWRSKNN